MKLKKVTAMMLTAVVGLSMTACAGKEETAEVTSVIVETARPEYGDVAATTTYMGTASPADEVAVYPMVSGTVTETNYKVGDTVSEGDVLFKIDDSAARLQLASANASYNSASASAEAATDGAREVQDSQTENQIDALRDTRDSYKDKIKDADSQIASLNEKLPVLQAAAEAAKAVYDQKEAEYRAALALPTIDENGNPVDTSGTVETTKFDMEAAKTAYDSAAGALGTIQSSVAQLDAAKDQYWSALDQTNSSLGTAKDAYEITKDKVYGQQDAIYDAQLSAASVGIDSAKMQLDYYTIEAPISGTIEAVSVEENTMASAGYTAYVISNKENMEVSFGVTEAVAKTLASGDAITAERSGQIYTGTITEVGGMAGAQTKLFPVKASLGRAEGLSSGVSIKVTAVTQKAEGVLVIPYDAIYFQNGKSYVYVVEDGKAEKTEVTTGLMNDKEVEVVDGVTADTEVITTWSSQLKDGVPVAVKGADSTENTENENTEAASGAEDEDAQGAEPEVENEADGEGEAE